MTNRFIAYQRGSDIGPVLVLVLLGSVCLVFVVGGWSLSKCVREGEVNRWKGKRSQCFVTLVPKAL